MKYIILLMMMLLFVQKRTAFAQSIDAKRDYVWRSGMNGRQMTYWNFHRQPTQIYSMPIQQTNNGQLGLICDENGALLLFSNGCYIVDKNDSIIRGSSAMNEGTMHDVLCPPNSSGYGVTNNMLVLPSVSNTHEFHFFHGNVTSTPDFITDRLMMTTVLQNNTGFAVTSINTVLIRDSIESGHLTACRHANGRDWWVIQPRENSNKYYKVLLQPDGISTQTQNIGYSSTAFENSGGQAVFSPDGRKYVRYNIQSDIRIFDFDRCSGLLSNPIHIPIQDAADSIWFAGCAISASSRYLYVSSTNHVYQFDLLAQDIPSSKQTVLTNDLYQEFPNVYFRFTNALLGPDGKIYITSNYRWYLHTIEFPDSVGLSCHAIQRSVRLNGNISYSSPNFPNFRLGVLRASPCDTLTTTQDELLFGSYNLKLYPNPADDHLNIDVNMPSFEYVNPVLEIVDVLGKQVYWASLPPFTSIHNADVSSFANGVYVVILKINGQMKIAQKVTILH